MSQRNSGNLRRIFGRSGGFSSLMTAAAIAASVIFSASLAQALAEPDYQLLATIDGIEYRRYHSYLVVETIVDSETDRNEAANTGFRRLFNYISGDNAVQTSIEMTVPVQQKSAAQGWSIAFVAPSRYNRDTVPRPANPDVYIREIPSQLVAVKRYSGRWTDRNLQRETDALLAALEKAGVRPIEAVMSAVYNAPYTLPFMRRNEVIVAVDRIP